MNGRDFRQMLKLAPGVNAANSSVNGMRTSGNNYQIDGADNNDAFHNSSAVNQGGVAGNIVGLSGFEDIDIGDTIADLDAVLGMFASITRISEIETRARKGAFRGVNLAEIAAEVYGLSAQVLSVVEEGDRYVASVRFTGQIKDLQSQEVESFDEVWHLIQFHNIGVWQLAGIQQS